MKQERFVSFADAVKSAFTANDMSPDEQINGTIVVLCDIAQHYGIPLPAIQAAMRGAWKSLVKSKRDAGEYPTN